MTIKAILFGSIGTIIETSDIQRNCFNQAFQKVGLNWHWSKTIYKSMLKKPGGEKRVRKYSLENNTFANAKKIRNLKTFIFNNYLKKNKTKPRPGVLDIINYCKRNNIKIGFVTSTTKNNIDSVFLSTGKFLSKKDFNYIGNNNIGKNIKTKLEVYKHCLKKLKLKNYECIAIEDTEISMKSANKAKIKCIAFPGNFHTDSKFNNSLVRVRKLKINLFKKLQRID
jgi:beta-phosphoglucomutase-like phosphatase (HAD superfamily)